MDKKHSTVPLGQSHLTAKRRFWSMRKQIVDNDEKIDQFNKRPHTASMNIKQKKTSRLAIWKNWFLTLIRSKTKITIDQSSFERECTLPSLSSWDVNARTSQSEVMQAGTYLKPLNAVNINKGQLGMSIILPPGVRGKNIKIRVELKVIPTNENHKSSTNWNGLYFFKTTEKGPYYLGTIAVPPGTSIFQISKMPLYFLNGDTTTMERKVETIVSPINTHLPESIDEALIVETIIVRLQFETHNVFKSYQLDYKFHHNLIPMIGNGSIEETSLKLNSSLVLFKPREMINELASEFDLVPTESSKVLVKEILHQVISKLSLHSTEDFIENFHKELEVQKVLLLETASSILPNPDSLLSKISETEHEDFQSKPSSAKSSSKHLSQDSFVIWDNNLGQLIQTKSRMLQVPSNTPDTFKISQQETEIRKKVKKEVRADIDMTLGLLDAAKNKLLNYIKCTNIVKQTNETGFDSTDQECQYEPTSSTPESLSKAIPWDTNDLKLNSITSTFINDSKNAKDDFMLSDKNSEPSVIHQLKDLMRKEFIKITGTHPPINTKDPFDLDNLQYINIYIPNKDVEKLVHPFLSHVRNECYKCSSNSKQLKKQHAHDKIKVSNEMRIMDAQVIIQELLHDSETFKMFKRGQKKQELQVEALDTVKHILEEIVQRVEEAALIVPQVNQVNCIYYCFIDVHVLPIAGRNWLAHRLERCLRLMEMLTENRFGTVERKSKNYATCFLKLGNNRLFSLPAEDVKSKPPPLPKAKEIITFKKKEGKSSSSLEVVEKVINPEKETSKLYHNVICGLQRPHIDEFFNSQNILTTIVLMVPSSILKDCKIENSSNESTTSNTKKVNFTDPDPEIIKEKVEGKKSFRCLETPMPSDTAIAGPSTEFNNPPELQQLHTGNNQAFISNPMLVDVANSERILQPAADIPRRFESEADELIYMNNIAVLQQKLRGSSSATLSSTSSSDASYDQIPIVILPILKDNPSIETTHTYCSDDSRANYLSYSTSGSVISSRSAYSAPNTVDYYADIDNYQQILPDLRQEYNSRPEMNQPEEIAKIEDNVLKNERLNPQMKSLSQEANLYLRKSSVDSWSSTSLKSTSDAN